MLHELRVENLLLVARAELRLSAGLNAITGETGAGKTMLAQALDLLLGGRAGSGTVRAGASEAYVEGIFARPPGLGHPVLEQLPDDTDELILARRVWPDGRTRAYLCGRSVTVNDLRELGPGLLAFYGQHEHRKLMLGAAQMEILDRHCGPKALALRDRVGELHARVRELEAEHEALLDRSGARERELDLVRFELEEIEAASPAPEEWDELTAERDRLRHLDALQSAVAAGNEALVGEPGGVGERLSRVIPALESAAAIDPALAPLAARLESLRYEAEDIASDLTRYGGEIEAAPGRLEEVEERLGVLSRLMRKYGGTVEAVLRHGAECRDRAGQLGDTETAIDALESLLQEARAERGVAAERLGKLRREGAPKLAKAVRRRLADLAMPDAEFEVELVSRADGCGRTGAETVEFVLAPNPGLPPGRLRDIASGGELSRVMLALLSTAHGQSGNGRSPTPSDHAPLLVFDEIDTGVGGHTARAVGEHLRKVAQGRQVLCITHLPQVAALADRHFTIDKDGSCRPALAIVRHLEGDDVVGELVRMLGAGPDDVAAGDHARQLMRQAA